MAVNRYDRPAEAPILNTYVPINFGELYRIGSAQKEAVDRAANEISGAIQTFGQFQSPSAIDTQRYYEQSIGQLSDLVEQAATNPDAMKDANFRSRLQSRINNLDYATLSNLRQSSQNLQARQQSIAKMQAAGRYNPNWDEIDISNWDTATAGIMNELAPVEYLNANELSNKYFDNLKPGSLPDVWKNGIKYNAIGNTYEDLLAVAKAHQNDLINTPQGQQYYKQFLKQYEGNEEQAREAFTDMVAQSQIDRTLRPTLTPDPLFMENLKMQYRYGAQGANVQTTLPTRLDFINASIQDSTNRQLGVESIGQYRNYIADIASKYGPNDKISKDAKSKLGRIDSYIEDVQNNSRLYAQYADAYNQTGDERYLIAAENAKQIATQRNMQLQGMAQSTHMLDQFRKAAGFDAFNKSKDNFSSEGYVKGVNRAINSVKASIPVGTQDALLTELRGLPTIITDENGVQHSAYQFTNSQGFLLPETVFQTITKTTPRQTKRQAGIRKDPDFNLKELIETGSVDGVSFIPDNGVVQVGDNKLLTGKIRIPKSEIQQKLGRGIWSSGMKMIFYPFGQESTYYAIKRLFGGKEVTQKVGDDGVEYFEIDAMRALPSEQVAPAYWQNVNQYYQQGQNYGGIGGASQAKGAYEESARQTLGLQ